MVAERLPDLILLDVEMPMLDGPGMAEAVAIQRAGLARIPIVVVSAACNIREIATCVGAAHYLKKPFSACQVVEIVDLALDSRRR